jgi:hypothetical protein
MKRKTTKSINTLTTSQPYHRDAQLNPDCAIPWPKISIPQIIHLENQIIPMDTLYMSLFSHEFADMNPDTDRNWSSALDNSRK